MSELEEFRETIRKHLSDDTFNQALSAERELVESQVAPGDKESFVTQIHAWILPYGGTEMVNVLMVFALNMTDEQARMCMIGAGSKMADIGYVLMAFYTSEGWTRELREGDDMSRNIADMKDKSEALMIFGQTLDRRRNSHTFMMKRGNNNAIILGREFTMLHGDENSDKIRLGFMDDFYKGHLLQLDKNKERK